MYTAVSMVHQVLGYALLLLAVAELALAGSGATTEPAQRRACRLAAFALTRVAGGPAVLLGILLWAWKGYPLASPWIWGSLLLWGPVEMAGARLIVPELRAEGGSPARLAAGAAVQLLALLGIVAMMTLGPPRGGP